MQQVVPVPRAYRVWRADPEPRASEHPIRRSRAERRADGVPLADPPSRFALGVTASVLATLSLAAPVAAGESTGCAAVNRGSLNSSMSAGSSGTRTVPLESGEALTLTVSSEDEARLSVTANGDMLQNSRGSSLVFVAPNSNIFEVTLEAGNASAATLSARCSSVEAAAAERALLDRRKAFVTSRDPDRIRIDRPAGEAKALDSLTPSETDGALPRDVKASISLSELAAAMKVGTPHQSSILDFWFEGRFTSYDTVDVNARQSDGSFSEMYFGSKYMLGPDIMLGYLAQFDQTGEDTLGGSTLKASGWMAGPYMSVRFGHGIYFDGRAAWGVSETLPAGMAVGSQAADRSLVRGTLRGERQVKGWTVAPSVGLSYAEDTAAFEGSSGQAATAGTGRLDMLPEVKRRFELDSKTYVEPRVAAGGFMSFDNLSEIAPGGIMSTTPDLHWKAEAGVAYGVKDSMNVQATGGVESGGEAAPDNWSGKLQLNMPLGN
jgi:hypothetical protein